LNTNRLPETSAAAALVNRIVDLLPEPPVEAEKARLIREARAASRHRRSRPRI
jgi:hypothetical protein